MSDEYVRTLEIENARQAALVRSMFDDLWEVRLLAWETAARSNLRWEGMCQAYREEFHASRRAEDRLDAVRNCVTVLEDSNTELRQALNMLELAAGSREATMGDPCDLLTAKDELRRARTAARAILARPAPKDPTRGGTA